MDHMRISGIETTECDTTPQVSEIISTKGWTDKGEGYVRFGQGHRGEPDKGYHERHHGLWKYI